MTQKLCQKVFSLKLLVQEIDVILSFVYSAPTLPPANISASNLSSTSIQVFWSEVPLDGRNGIVRKYRVHYRESSSLPEETLNLTLVVDKSRTQQINNGTNINTNTSENRFSVNITGLKIFTNYTIMVQAITVAAGNISEPLVACTGEDSKCLFCRSYKLISEQT